MKKNKQIGSTLEDFLQEEGRLGEATAIAIKRVLAYQIERHMEQTKITKTSLATTIGISRSALDHLLDPNHTGTTIKTLGRAADAMGKELNIELVDRPKKKKGQSKIAQSSGSR